MDAGTFLRQVRLRHGLDQRSLAARARTSQAQISRIERGEISPSVSTLERLLAAMGERLELVSTPAPAASTQIDVASTVAVRVREAAELSYALTSIAARRTRR